MEWILGRKLVLQYIYSYQGEYPGFLLYFAYHSVSLIIFRFFFVPLHPLRIASMRTKSNEKNIFICCEVKRISLLFCFKPKTNGAFYLASENRGVGNDERGIFLFKYAECLIMITFIMFFAEDATWLNPAAHNRFLLFKGTQEWEIFWLWFWILYYFFVSYMLKY